MKLALTLKISPLMVEAIPLSGESVMLVITKIEDPEELDTCFFQILPLFRGWG